MPRKGLDYAANGSSKVPPDEGLAGLPNASKFTDIPSSGEMQPVEPVAKSGGSDEGSVDGDLMCSVCLELLWDPVELRFEAGACQR